MRTSLSHTFRLPEPSSTASALDFPSFQMSARHIHSASASAFDIMHVSLVNGTLPYPEYSRPLLSTQQKNRAEIEALFRTLTDATPALRH